MVMKFGGTSVADAARLQRVVAIVTEAAPGGLIVVVSALAGVTDDLLHCTAAIEEGELTRARETLGAIRARHEALAAELLPRPAGTAYIAHIAALAAWAEELCRRAAARELLAPEEAAEIAGLGEQMAAPLVASAIAAAGQRSQALAATELISLDASGQPDMARTTSRCRARLRPLLQRGVAPVVTGFICRRDDAAPATLGRGGSDYSATLIAAAMAARAATIWTDVDGMHAADPRLAPGAQVLSELSYEQASRLAGAGAKVLHPKCLEPARLASIPIWIRNARHPERPGTRVSGGAGADHGAAAGPFGVAALPNQALLTFRDPLDSLDPELRTRAWAVLARLNGGGAYCFVPSAGRLQAAVAETGSSAALAAWRRALGLAPDDPRLRLDRGVAVLSAASAPASASESAEIAARGAAALLRAGIACLTAGAAAEPGVTGFVVAQADLPAALRSLHRELITDAEPDRAAEPPPRAGGNRGEAARRTPEAGGAGGMAARAWRQA